MRRFYAHPRQFSQDVVTLDAEETLHLARVLRLGVGARAQIGYWDYGRFGVLHPTVGFKTDRPFAWTPFWQMAQMPAGVKNISVCPVLLMASSRVITFLRYRLARDMFNVVIPCLMLVWIRLCS